MDHLSLLLVITVIIILGAYFYLQYKHWTSKETLHTWPKVKSRCPDYWTEKQKNVCTNDNNLGKCPTTKSGSLEKKGVVDFNASQYTGPRGQYEKCKWAKHCHATWEGIDTLCA